MARALGADPDIVGRTIRTPNGPIRVVGVAHPALEAPERTQFWINLQRNADHIAHDLYGFARLRPGATPETIRDPMARAMEDLAVKYPEMNRNRIFVLTPMLDAVVGDLRAILVIVFGAAGLLLGLTCLNVTHLLLARAVSRMRDMAVRAALGASRWRIVRHALVESLLLASAGGLLGLAAAYAGVRVLLALGASEFRRLETVAFDGSVWLFALAATLVKAAVVGVVPALRAAGADPLAAMNGQGRGASGSIRTRRLLGGFIVLEVAVGLALVTATGLMVRSYAHLRNVDAGFTLDDRLIVDVLLPRRYADPERHVQWFAAVSERIRAIGASGVAGASSLPLRPERDTTTFVDIVGRTIADPHQRPNARLRVVTPEYFGLMRTPLVAGRTFAGHDSASSPAVAIVNESFVRRFWPDADPLKERLRLPGFRMQRTEQGLVEEEITVVGVVADTNHAGLHTAAEQTLYMPHAQLPLVRSLVISASSERLEGLATDVRDVLRAIDSEVAFEFTSHARVVASSTNRQRTGMALMMLLGAAAMALLAIGVFGVVGFAVSERTRELAIRLALGAQKPQVFAELLAQTTRLAAAGALIGCLLAWWAGRSPAGYVYGVEPVDPAIWALGVSLVLAVTIGAAILPAARAAGLDPARVLRAG